jgi:hypothetical protein
MFSIIGITGRVGGGAASRLLGMGTHVALVGCSTGRTLLLRSVFQRHNGTPENGQTRALQERSLFQSQQYVTTVYRSELALRLHGLGYEIERGKHGQPEIKDYSQEYLDASSPRREQIAGHLQEIGRDGAGAAQVAAHRTRDSKEVHSPEEVLKRHRELAAQFGHQADGVVAEARLSSRHHAQQSDKHTQQPEKTVQQSVT